MKINQIKGTIEVLTGLHIGGGDDVMKIGGIDNPIIKDINTNRPYIPGSSIKGKMRSLLEWHHRLVAYGEGRPFGSDKLKEVPAPNRAAAELIIKLFGDSNAKNKGEFGITRISVSDCKLSMMSQKMKLSEAKYENVINRRTGKAEHPRQTERVPAGVRFDFDIKVKILDGDDESALMGLVHKGIELLENDYLGGSGSRGYGRIKFHIES